MEFLLSSKEKHALLDAHKTCREKHYADRIKTIFKLNYGTGYQTISAWVLNDNTL